MTTPRTFSTGFGQSKILTRIEQLRYSLRKDRDLAESNYLTFVEAWKVLEEYLGTKIDEARVLEIGCGQRFPTTLLFHTFGADVMGIDTDFVDPDFSLKGYFSILRMNGFERLTNTAMRHLLFDRKYYSMLSSRCGRPLKFENLNIQLMDACNLQFADSHFDYVFSHAVFEHIYDVEKACDEVHRVLRGDGIANIRPHLFPSISGGHNLEWFDLSRKDNRSTPPWGHLRQNLMSAPCFLNKLREKDYLAIFQKKFSILDIESEYCGEEYLTEDILRALPEYTRDELLKVSIRVVMKKK